jgi:hypothetical protein
MTVAPATGCRCRRCGANAAKRPADESWVIYNGAAFCPDCAKQRQEERAEALAVDCPNCRAAAGQKCKNYRGQNKATCPERGRPAVEAPPAPPAVWPQQMELFES